MGVIGFKQSEVGTIPETWDARRLGTLGRVVRGGSPRPAGDPRYFDGSFIPWLTVAALTNIPDHQLEVTRTFGHLTEEGSHHSRTLASGTLIIANSGATLGVAKTLGITCCANDGIAAIEAQRDSSEAFVAYCINAQTARLREVVASGNGQPNLNTSLIASIAIPLPPLVEQQAIAAALSDVDALLGALDRLIAKKRDLKRAAMQQLLTGQTRLPGFGGKWEMKRLGDHVAFLRNGTHSRAELDEAGPVRYLHYGDVHSASSCVIDAERTAMPRLAEAKARTLDRLQSGDIVFVDASEDLAGVGKAVELRLPPGMHVVAGLHTIAARFDKLVLADGFKAYLQFVPLFRKHMTRLAAGTKVYATSRRHIADLTMPLPSAAEQVAIAAALEDMDAELNVLEQRRDKTRLLKQGMMQELLTGRTRLA